MKQVAEVSQLCTTDKNLWVKAEQTAASVLSTVDPTTLTAPELTAMVHKELRKIFNKADLYQDVKKRENDLALSLLPQVQSVVDNANDPLEMAIKVAVLGNVIDYGSIVRFDIRECLDRVESLSFSIFDYNDLQADLQQANHILYVGDNTGEIVFDKILVQKLIAHGCKVTYVVKSDYALNDITMADAEYVQMTTLTKVIESGSTTPGTLMHEATPEFVAAYTSADVVIAKGQGNLETMDKLDKAIYFLLKMKCPYLATSINTTVGDLILWKKSPAPC